MSSEDELIDVVDEQDQVIDTRPKKDFRKRPLLHRAVLLLLFNSKNELFVHQRALIKKDFPGFWAICVGGFVDHGEDYDTAAKRELLEETGVQADIAFLTKLRYTVEKDDFFAQLYKVVSDDKIKLQEEELEQGFFIPLAALDTFVDAKKLKPSDKFIYDNFKELLR